MSAPEDSENYWPTIDRQIKRWLVTRTHICSQIITRESLGIESIICSICRTNELTIADFKPDGDEDGAVLACGHFLGRECMTEWNENCRDRAQPITCPFCRCSLSPERCEKHGVKNMDVGGVDEPFEVVSDRVNQMMKENKESAEATRTCEDCMVARGERPPRGQTDTETAQGEDSKGALSEQDITNQIVADALREIGEFAQAERFEQDSRRAAGRR